MRALTSQKSSLLLLNDDNNFRMALRDLIGVHWAFYRFGVHALPSKTARLDLHWNPIGTRFQCTIAESFNVLAFVCFLKIDPATLKQATSQCLVPSQYK